MACPHFRCQSPVLGNSTPTGARVYASSFVRAPLNDSGARIRAQRPYARPRRSVRPPLRRANRPARRRRNAEHRRIDGTPSGSQTGTYRTSSSCGNGHYSSALQNQRQVTKASTGPPLGDHRLGAAHRKYQRTKRTDGKHRTYYGTLSWNLSHLMQVASPTETSYGRGRHRYLGGVATPLPERKAHVECGRGASVAATAAR